VTADLLFLNRPRSMAARDLSGAALYASDGSSIGAGITASAIVGLHF
jgi:hypothetical protein